MKLRDYQNKIIEELQARMKAGVRRLLVVAPTGSGKTVLAVRMLGGAVDRGLKALFVVHRRELVKQSVRAFSDGGVPCGVIAAGEKFERGFPVYVCSILTLINRMNDLPKIDLCIWDEAHHMSAKSWVKAYKAFDSSWHIGLTATPERLDGRGLDKYFDQMVMGPNVRELIDRGSLSDYEYYAPNSSISLDNIRTVAGDYSRGELGDLMDVPTITNKAVDEYLKLAPGKRFLVFAVNIEHSQHIVDEFQRKGVLAQHVDAKTHQDERDAAIVNLADGRLNVLSNIGLFGEGVDLPSLDGISILRPTKSLALHLQMCGRCLRPSPNKEKAIIIDHVKNLMEHGLPCEDRSQLWKLEGRKKKETDGTTKFCEKCFCAIPPLRNRCPACNAVITTEERGPRNEVVEVEGEIVKVDPEAVKKKRIQEMRNAKDYESLVKLGQRRNYKRPDRWAMHIMRARAQKKS